MNQPIPRNGNEPLKIGDRVQIVPEWQDPGDGKYERFGIEAPEDCTRVRIQAIIPGLFAVREHFLFSPYKQPSVASLWVSSQL